MTKRSQLPKALREPIGVSLADEPEIDKALRLLRGLRYMIEHNQWTLGITLGDAQIMLVRYRPKPVGPHNPDADLSGVEL